MDIVIVAQYMRNIEDLEQSNSRFWYIAKLLKKNGHQIEIVTSDFHHEKKRHFSDSFNQDGIKITLCHEDGYPKNVCLKRFISHKKLAKNVKKYMASRRCPDLIYTAVPSLDVAYEIVKYCKKVSVPFIVDIQDLWPEAFKMVFNIPFISSLVFLPMTIKANKIYKNADEIIAVSKTYLNRALQKNNNIKGQVVYLGTDKEQFDCYSVKKSKIKNNKIKIGYVGTLGNSYDLDVVFSAIKKMQPEEKKNIEMIVMGDGPRRLELEKKACGLPIIFLGQLPYSEMVEYLSNCDIAVNPIKAKSAGSIINKHMDYAMAGLPVINTQESSEYRTLLNEWQCGINCECGNSEDVLKALQKLISYPELRLKMGIQSRKMGEAIFDRRNMYQKIVNIIQKFNYNDSEKDL